MRTPVSCDSKCGIELNLYLIRREIEELKDKVYGRSDESLVSKKLRELSELAESIVRERGL